MEQLTLSSQNLREAAKIIRAYCDLQCEELDGFLSNIQMLSAEWQDDETFSRLYDEIHYLVEQSKGYFDELVSCYPPLFEKKADSIDSRPVYAGNTVNNLSGTESWNSKCSPIIVEQVDYTFDIKKHGKAWTDHLPADEMAAIKDYTGHYYRNINAVLRGLEKSFDDGNDQRCLKIHNALKNADLPFPCTVYRGTSIKALGKFAKLSDRKLVGKLLFDDAFMSTSLNQSDAFKDEVLFEISVPAGANAAYVGSISKAADYESEVLFDAGQIMRITNARRDEFGRRVISVQLL